MTLHHLDDIKIKDLTLPFEFETEGSEGLIDIYLYRRFNRTRTFGGEKLKPYLYSCERLGLWGDVDEGYTIGQIKKDIMDFKQKNHNL